MPNAWAVTVSMLWDEQLVHCFVAALESDLQREMCPCSAQRQHEVPTVNAWSLAASYVVADDDDDQRRLVLVCKPASVVFCRLK